MGSDWGVSTANVMEEIDVAVSRTCPEGEPLGPEEAMTPIQALVAFTLGSAYINHCEQDRGSVAVGKLADLVVLDRDPLREGPIRDAEVVSTIAGGRVVYER
jgi:predicted amidohydrolase YtcJ